jgi:hypothetical protein
VCFHIAEGFVIDEGPDERRKRMKYLFVLMMMALVTMGATGEKIVAPHLNGDNTVSYKGVVHEYSHEVTAWVPYEDKEAGLIKMRYFWGPKKDGILERGVMRVVVNGDQTMAWGIYAPEEKIGLLDQDCDGVMETVLDAEEAIIIPACFKGKST